MSLTNCCTPACPTPQTIQIPGPQGASGIALTTAAFVLPAIGANVVIHMTDTSWVTAVKNIFISDGTNFANFAVVSVDSTTQITAVYLGMVNDSAPATTIQSGALVQTGLGNYAVPFDLDTLAAFTDNTSGVKAYTIPISVCKQTIVIGPFSMALLVNGQIWKVPVPFAYLVNTATFRCDVAITTGAKAATLQPQINGVACTGGAMAVAGTYASGATQAGTAISGNNIGTAGLTLEIAVSAVTAFTEGYGHVELNITNTDLSALVAALAFNLNQLRHELRHQ